jgi:hypothetical protein
MENKYKTLKFCLMIFNFEKEKAKRFLHKNSEKTEEEIIAILNSLEYGNW